MSQLTKDKYLEKSVESSINKLCFRNYTEISGSILKLAETDLRDQFTEEARKIIQQRVGEETQDWETVTEDLRQLGEKLLGETTGNMKQRTKTCWWNEDVQENIQTKKLAKITVDKDNNEENKAA